MSYILQIGYGLILFPSGDQVQYIYIYFFVSHSVFSQSFQPEINHCLQRVGP